MAFDLSQSGLMESQPGALLRSQNPPTHKTKRMIIITIIRAIGILRRIIVINFK